MSWIDLIKDAPTTARYHSEAVDQIVQCVHDGVFCALLGPRLCGKTVLLRFIELSLAPTLGWTCVYIDLTELQAPTMQGFFAELTRLTATNLERSTGSSIAYPNDDLASSATFRGYLADCVSNLHRDIVLIIEHLEGLPTDLAQALLTSLRAAYMDQQNLDYRVTVVLSGALSLATLTLGESSPFRGIARRVFIGDLTIKDSRALIDEYLSTGNVIATRQAMGRLLEAVSGDHYLIRILCQRCVELMSDLSPQRLGSRSVDRVLKKFLDEEVYNYAPLLEAVRLIEEDPDLLESLLKLLNREVVSKSDLPLPLSPDLDPLYLTGVVERVDGNAYRLQNGIYRRFLESYFAPSRVGHMLAMAGRWDAALDYLEASSLEGGENISTDLLPATINSMHASDDLMQAAHFLLRGLIAAFCVGEAQIWYASPQENVLRLIGEVGEIGGASLWENPEISLQADQLEARSYRQAVSLRGKEHSDHVKRVIPLAISGSDPIGVVTIWEDSLPDQIRAQRERELQIQGYLYQAARAFQAVSVRRQELTLAGRMQASLLPNTIPELDGYQLAVTWRPARETSGDFYDFIDLPENRLGLVIADVVDKGIGAALYMALCRTLLRTYAQEYPNDPNLAIKATNDRMLQDAERGNFVTIFYGILDPIQGSLTYCNAGHNPPLLMFSGWNLPNQILRRTGMALGVTEETVWNKSKVQLPDGATMVFYTDGVIDAQDQTDQAFGSDRLFETISLHDSESAYQIQSRILTAVRKHTNEAAQLDDMTLMILKRV